MRAGPGRRSIAEAGPSTTEVERVLWWVERNLIVLTRNVPMAEIEDLPLDAAPCSGSASSMGSSLPTSSQHHSML
jgi:hypothetical protein